MPQTPLDIEAFKRAMRESESKKPRNRRGLTAQDLEQGPAPASDRLAQLVRSMLPDLGGEQTPLTQRMFGGDTGFIAGAVDKALKIAPLAVGFGTGAGLNALTRPLQSKGLGLLADAGVGAISGAASGATQAAIQEQPIAPSAAMGGLLGAGAGVGVWSITGAGRRLAAAYAARPGRGAFPRIAQLDEQIPSISLESTENVTRAQAARAAFRNLVPAHAAEEIKRTNPVLFARAVSEARRAAKASTSEIPPGSLEIEGDTARRMFDGAFRIQNDRLRYGSVSAVRHYWGVYVTRLGTMLARDPEFGPYGARFGDMIRRTDQLGDALEGALHTNVIRPLWRGVPKAGEERVDAILSGRGGQGSSQEMAIVKRWRELSDEAFDEMQGLKLMEEVSPTHPAVTGGQQDLFPDMPREATGKWKIVPIQHRTNYVPYYRDPAGIAKLMKRGSPERNAELQKIIGRGDADNLTAASEILDEMLSADSHWTPLHIRTGPMQHERELSYGLPRDTNAKRWMERWAHDYSRRIASAQVVGGQDEALKALTNEMREAGFAKGAARVERIWQTHVSRPPADVARMAPIARAARSFVAVNMLSPRTGILQMLQLANPAARMGLKRTLEGIAAGFRNPALRDAADEVGALLPSRHLLTAEEPVEALGRMWVNYATWMPYGDRMARFFSALTAGVTAKQWAKEYWRLAQMPRMGTSVPRTGIGAGLKYVGIRNPAERAAILGNKLENTLGISVKHVLETEGELPIESVMAAMRNGSHDTQFANSILDLPEARRTGTGQLLYMLKTYSKQQSTLFMKMVADAKRGDTGPIARLLLTYPALYASVKPFLDFFSNKDAVDEADKEALERAGDALMGALQTGMFGGLGDFITQMSASDPGRFLGHVAGPVASTAAGAATDVWKLATEGDYMPLVKRATPRLVRNMWDKAKTKMEE